MPLFVVRRYESVWKTLLPLRSISSTSPSPIPFLNRFKRTYPTTNYRLSKLTSCKPKLYIDPFSPGKERKKRRFCLELRTSSRWNASAKLDGKSFPYSLVCDDKPILPLNPAAVLALSRSTTVISTATSFDRRRLSTLANSSATSSSRFIERSSPTLSTSLDFEHFQNLQQLTVDLQVSSISASEMLHLTNVLKIAWET